jgi:hypothetical protein
MTLPTDTDAQEPPLDEQLQEFALRKKRHTAEEQALEIEQARLVQLLLAEGDTERTLPLFTAKLQTTSQSRIVPEVLIARGVDPDIVKEATKSTTSKPFLRFYPRGE